VPSEDSERKQVRAALLKWFKRAARDLPWRRTRDPYAIWVSEVMLQQTRVDTVLRYYDRFLEKFPTTHALADAAQDDVMAAWSGLGYYRRARLLHAGVREVVTRYEGVVPREAEARRALPGVGRYTAGAIGSIAFDAQEPIVDGNVARVLCRLHAIDTAPEDKRTQAFLWTEAEALAQGKQPGALNQALMELGATVCTKAAPLCASCPVQRFCDAHAQGRVTEIPRAKTRTAPKRWQLVALVATAGAAPKVLLTRGDGSLFGGLWNLPMLDGHGLADARALAEQLGATLQAPRPLGMVKHVLSHRAIELQLWYAQASQAPDGEARRLVAPDQLKALGVSQLTRKALALAGLASSTARSA
jgi:A/G-specific adenine glycosylase